MRRALLGLMVVVACRRAEYGPRATVSERIVHGTMSVTGTQFEQRLVLQTGNGALRIRWISCEYRAPSCRCAVRILPPVFA